uniref:Protein arginine methyltransferase NDUFAF7 n=1 Tax=Opuntia streptacantha TaxID=393608 RepID=A0A7C9AV30_OPUST
MSLDLSAYVDFASIRYSTQEASENVSVHGPIITQSQFLGSLGINFRVETLLENCTTDEQAELLQDIGVWWVKVKLPSVRDPKTKCLLGWVLGIWLLLLLTRIKVLLFHSNEARIQYKETRE